MQARRLAWMLARIDHCPTLYYRWQTETVSNVFPIQETISSVLQIDHTPKNSYFWSKNTKFNHIHASLAL